MYRGCTLAVLFVGLSGCGDASDLGVGAGPDAGVDAVYDVDVAHDANLVNNVTDGSTAEAEPAPDAAADAAPAVTGFIGSPCETVADCDYEDAACVTEGFPGGLCTKPCDSLCPDQDGHPVTFCAEAAALPASPPIVEGACVSRCDMGIYPDTGCRPGYGCSHASRPGDPSSVQMVCLPGAPSELTSCHHELAARGVSFEPAYVADRSPDTHPGLTCHVEDPVWVHSPIHGVELRDSGGTATARVLGSCAMIHALTSTVDDVASEGVVAVRHMGTYNCRVIAGTDSLSRHAFGDAIDLAGFEFDDGRLYTVIDDWEHDTTTPQTVAGQFLYAAAHRWFDAGFWTIILTPNYNVDHDDHFHVDLTPGAPYIGFHDGRYIGPAPYAD